LDADRGSKRGADPHDDFVRQFFALHVRSFLTTDLAADLQQASASARLQPSSCWDIKTRFLNGLRGLDT
jgi:hypothetical protein